MDYSHGAITYCPIKQQTIGVCVNYTNDVITSYDCKYETCNNINCELKETYPIGKSADVKTKPY